MGNKLRNKLRKNCVSRPESTYAPWFIRCLSKDYYIDGKNTRQIFFENTSTGGGKKVLQITPRGWIFGTMIFYNLKSSSQDLSNDGSNFILSSLEVGH